jgi:hypothetical protein
MLRAEASHRYRTRKTMFNKYASESGFHRANFIRKLVRKIP